MNTPARLGLLVSGVGVGVLVLAAALTGSTQASPFGLPDPGALTRWLLPLLALAQDAAAVMAAAGALITPLTMHRMRDDLAPRALTGLRVTSAAAVVWLLLGVVEMWAIVSDQWATPLTQTPLSIVRESIGTTSQVTSLAAQSLVLLALAVGARRVRNGRNALLVLAAVLVALVPTLLTGHSASSGSHDAAVVSLLLHVLSVVIWTGGVVALWGLLGADETVRGLAVRRFSAVAVWCFGIAAASGAVNAYVRLTAFSDFFTSAYGRAALAKVALLVVLGVVAARLRRSVAAAPAAPPVRTFSLLTAIELTAMSAAFALGAALSRTAPPVGEPWTGQAESLLGGPLPPAPNLTRVLTSVQFSGIGVTIVVLGALAYLVGLRTLRRRGDKWPVGRTVAWFLGLVTVGFATIGGLGVYSHVMFSIHMTSHMMLSMLAPVLLVLGSPITLAIRALPGPEKPGGDGPRQVLVAFLNSPFSKVVTNPAFATIMFVGSLYGIYFTGIYDWLMANHLGHSLMEIHFLLAGYLYYEVLIGTAPLPKRLPHLGRLGLLVAIAPFHAFFAISVMSSKEVIGESYYSLLERPYATDLLADQNLGGGLTWALGEVPLLLVAIVLLFQWFRDDSRRAKQRDRQADRDDDAELEAYNAMLERIAENRANRGDRDPATRGQHDR